MVPLQCQRFADGSLGSLVQWLRAVIAFDHEDIADSIALAQGLCLPVTTRPVRYFWPYRFMGILPTDFGSEQLSGPLGLTTRTKVQLNDTLSNQIMFGVRYAFNQAPPPPPPAPIVAPAPAPARSYLVFFDWDKATLTDRAQQVIREAAQNSTRVQYTRIEVTGHTDTSGSPRYNQGLSVRRAQAVAAELVRDGVPQNAISIQGLGETHLLVPTGPTVREPQNRRVEIVLN